MFDVQAQVEECIENGQLVLANGKSMTVLSGSCKSWDMDHDYHSMPVTDGVVGGKVVKTLRDTGCNGVVVQSDLVDKKQFTGESVCCVMMDSTVREYPLAKIEVDTPFYKGEVVAMCMEKPLYQLVIGNIEGARNPNDPDRAWECSNRKVGSSECLGVETRAQKRAKLVPLKPLKVAEQVDDEVDFEDVKRAQTDDQSLKKYWKLARGKREPHVKGQSRYWYEEKKGLLYRIYQSQKAGRTQEMKQLVVPTVLRDRV